LGLRLAKIAALGVVATAAALPAPVLAATVNAQVQAKVVKPLILKSVQDFDFGTIILARGTWSGATVRLSQSGAMTCPANLTCSGAPQVAIYNVSGSQGQTVVLTVPNVTLVNAANPAAKLTLVPDSVKSVFLTNSGNPGTNVSIGGSITVDSTTPEGDYAGTFNVTAEYQ
jgi:hypothetical protein